jgi:hypothetical protein
MQPSRGCPRQHISFGKRAFSLWLSAKRHGAGVVSSSDQLVTGWPLVRICQHFKHGDGVVYPMRTRKIPLVEQVPSDNSVAIVKSELEIKLSSEEGQRFVSISRGREEAFVLAQN